MSQLWPGYTWFNVMDMPLWLWRRHRSVIDQYERDLTSKANN